MTGADIIGALLRAETDVTTLVAAEKIKGGKLPDGIALPALLVRLVSSVERQNLKRTGTTHTVDRIAVSVRARTYREQRDVIAAVKKCCAGLTGNVGGGSNVSILTAGTGPDLNGPADSFEQTQDFRVSYDATA
jgi:hypothetical protein